MADVQAQIFAFHEAIKLRRYDENQTLRDKRDVIRRRLDDRLPAIFERRGEECPDYYFLDQGSYAANTGIVPLTGDFDIDQGLYFDVDESWDAVALKQRVRDALAGHTHGAPGRAGVRIRRPCVTVQYHRNERPVYHVDLAVYADSRNFRDGLPRIAMGKEHSGPGNSGWEVADPRGLHEWITSAYREDDGRQFRRVIRYLKRWKDERFGVTGNAAPRGIALTVACHEFFEPVYRARDWPDDLAALQGVVGGMLEQFHDRPGAWFFGSRWRVDIMLPVVPDTNLCGMMTSEQVYAFRTKLQRLDGALATARRARTEKRAGEALQRVFGQGFPV
ncbi:nucleotidyltransferase [Longimicrobium terrae]|uniref:Cyclic GMP-AMP synthase n=1 Tax=Longimicrobium terrae TaxID=1639882 RepID=A0A841GWE7_9BACT|nr:nucleotidyltransferase [Longimicrobium terrae]MBB4635972.1 hypothetical protein [Longimicrobium terrae]MBB6070368.1 hypothetical protein [Longimicrobium terrae]NNC30865.1 nucleotidyltransferase [Longimicrobium terrae]